MSAEAPQDERGKYICSTAAFVPLSPLNVGLTMGLSHVDNFVFSCLEAGVRRESEHTTSTGVLQVVVGVTPCLVSSKLVLQDRRSLYVVV
jgi:hypothetical protein